MALKFDQKKTIVANLGALASSISVIAADYSGLTVSEMTKLRFTARKEGLVVKVVQNNLARRAFEKTDLEALNEVLVGPVVLIFSPEDPGVSARLVRSFAKDHKKLEVKGLVVESKLLLASQLQEVADLPTKEQALAGLLSVMMAPMNKVVRTMSEVYTQSVRVIARASEKEG